LNPASNFISTVCEPEGWEGFLAAQVRHRLGEQFAQMSYIIADAQAELDLVPAFLEALIKDCGEKGAFYLLSDLKSDSVLIEAFRQVDFNVWAKQRFYRLEDGISVPVQEDTPWRLWTNADLKAIHALCKSLVPKLFQNFEPLTRKTATVLVNDAPDGSLRGFVDVNFGPKGIVALPLMLPEYADEPEVILDMLAALPEPGHRPIYICVRSYQPWLEDLMQRLPTQSSSEHVLMIKFMAVRQKAHSLLKVRGFEKRADNGVPVVRSGCNK